MWGIDVGAGCAASVGSVGSVFLWGACRISGVFSRFHGECFPHGWEEGVIGAVDTIFSICSVRGREAGICFHFLYLHHRPHLVLIFSSDIIFIKMRENRPFWVCTWRFRLHLLCLSASLRALCHKFVLK